MKTILQIPIDKKLKNNAEKVANSQGFSSLQEIVRVFLAQLVAEKVHITVEPTIKLSHKNAVRYEKIADDFDQGKNVYVADSINDLMKQLNED